MISLSRRFLISTTVLLIVVAAFKPRCVAESPLNDSDYEFFESRIRPVLVEHCYPCHNSTETTEGGLSLDHRQAILDGGDGGPVIVSGDPATSRLVAVLKHEIVGLEMPEDGPKLDQRIVADFEKWITMGAPDPREHAPSSDEIAKVTSWQATLERRKKWWSFQPITSPTPPDGSGSPVDRFVQEKLTGIGLQPAPQADSLTLIRRLYVTLIGLPPKPGEVRYWNDKYSQGDHQAVTEELVDHLLTSDHFGERWARHWMDWIRYAESHGSEGDPTIDNAWLYRDYLIRALNSDVPYDQLLREHVAGDLLEDPRINERLGINESAIGPAHWRMVFHGFAPTDALDEKVRFIDDQINAFSKAFLGLTVSCARCHDHKFDAISQTDYYALFGILASCRPARKVIDLPERQNRNQAELGELKAEIRASLSKDWRKALDSLVDRIRAAAESSKQSKANDGSSVLALAINSDASEESLSTRWLRLSERAIAQQQPDTLMSWDLSQADDYADWYRHGQGLAAHPSGSGEFAVAAEGDAAIVGVYPAGVYSHTLTAKHPARLTSSDLQLDEESELLLRVIGDQNATVRYAVHDYPRNGTVYPVEKLKPRWYWRRFNLDYWTGDSIHVELVTGKDAPLLVKNDERSWFGVTDVLLVKKGQLQPEANLDYFAALSEVAAAPPETFDELVNVYATAIGNAIEAFESNSTSDAQAFLLDGCLREGLLPRDLKSLTATRPLIEEYRNLEQEIAVPTRVPGLDETRGRTQRLFVRGNHKQPGDRVPRRFLEAIDTSPYETDSSGRLRLADDLLRDDNPLTRRVIVNRVWHHLFGRGIVDTPDNFGQLGGTPSHPELLDWLATRFSQDRWSLKNLIRLIVVSETWRQSSRPSPKASEIDPGNVFLSHANVRRLDAESIRDALLAASGRLNPALFSEPTDGKSNRRSVYVRVIRNRLDPLLRAFDFPEPYSTTGRRDVTNVPAQSLMMMNDPQVLHYASALASGVLGNRNLRNDKERVSRMFISLFARPPSDEELEISFAHLESAESAINERRREWRQLNYETRRNRREIDEILTPVRNRLLEQAEQGAEVSLGQMTEPIARWDFDDNADDRIGSHHGALHGGASIEDGALVLQSGGYMTTSRIGHAITEKTLEAWVQLDNLTQRGGGVLTVQTPDGVTFDSIVFAEKDPQQWLAGSNIFARTQSFSGPRETDAVDRWVHVAIAFHPDGRIAGYRDGKPYGKPYQSNGPVKFKKDNWLVSLGVRHLPAGGNRMISGRIDRAQLYNRALTDEEIAASFQGSSSMISRDQVLAALDEDDRKTVAAKLDEIDQMELQLEKLKPVATGSAQQRAWTDLAHAMLTLKEFIYVR